VNERGVPLLSLGVSAVATVVCVAVNYALPGKALGMLMGLAVAGMMINWAMISWSHLRFRQAKAAQGVKPVFGSPFYPLTNWLCLAFLAGILVIMFLTPEMRVSVYLIPVWLGVLGVGYRLRKRKQRVLEMG
jgi:aromatic amino acid transport protein AroP